MAVDSDLTLETPRLILRPTSPADAPDFVRIQSDWNVMRMLRLADFPPTLETMGDWLAGHAQDRRNGSAFRFSIRLGDRVVGCVDIDEIREGRGELGYWLEAAAWGQGLAFEATSALMSWAFQTLDLTGLDSGCASDNLASARVLTKLGFERVGEAGLWSKPRNDWINQLQFSRDAPD